MDRIGAALLRQRGYLLTWVPVCLGIGIGIYFALPAEPDWRIYLLLALFCLAAWPLASLAGAAFGPLAIGLAIVAAGVMLAGARAHAVSEPVLGFRYYGPVQGRIVEIDRSAADLPRITLDGVVLEGVPPRRTPARVRLTLHGDQRWITPAPGMVVILTGHLSPPNGPSEPGDFDFRQMAWFAGLGAVGYTRNPVLLHAPPDPGGAALLIGRMRMYLADAVRARIPGDAGGYAAAVTTGDRSGLTAAANDAMRDSNLYHLVSISGMHMGMLAAFVFGLIRYGVALIPPLALRVSAKKVAALVALPVAAFYLALAGRDVPTERAFVTVAVMLVAVLLDRRALSLRSVALAALIVLLLRPESLVNPGFQMSFAAVVALVVVFGLMRDAPRVGSPMLRLALPGAMLVLSSLVAGTATAPYAAAHFNRVAHYGILANLLAVPAMGILVMPGAVLMAMLGPLGLERPAVLMVEYGSRWILWVAEQVAALDGAVSAVPAPPHAFLPLLTLGALFAVLWQGWGRLAGAVPVAVAFVVWLTVERPALLVAETGALIGVMTPEGRALSKPGGDGYAASGWLENDGSTRGQEAAAALPLGQAEGRMLRVSLGGKDLLVVGGKTALAGLDDCGGADILILNVPDDRARPCEVYDPARLRETGPLAGWLRDGALTVVTGREVAGDRLWTR